MIVGCGDVLRRALPWLVRRFRVYALVRSEAAAAAMRRSRVTPLRGDLDRAATLDRLAGLAPLVLHSAPPPDGDSGDPRTRRLVAALARRGSLPRRLVYISTTGVYGDCAGDWVSEARPANPQTARARRRVDAEGTLRRFGRRSGGVVSLLRAPGIYAGDRLPLERLRRGDPVLRPEDDVHTNHIHAEDLARLACLALFRGRPGRAYNASDDTRLRMGEYFDLVADSFGLARAPRVARANAREHLSPATLSFMSESRRLSNARIKREFGVRLRHPTVADGLRAACPEPEGRR